MSFCKISAAALAVAAAFFTFCNAAPSPALTPSKRDSKFSFGNDKIKGVNLGGWLVLEPWITPSIFEETDSTVVDEWTMGEALGKEEFERRLQQHWSTWITEKDLKEIKALGLNLVRIPIGYWAISPNEGDPYVQGAYEYLDKALGWAKKHGLKVMIDLHGAPGSQNGYDNSGHKGPIDWSKGDSVAQTLTALNKIRDDHASNSAVASIELLNEPRGPDLGKATVEDFYKKGYSNLHQSTTVAIQDAYEGVGGWNKFSQGKSDLLVDVHSYQIFKQRYLQRGLQKHIAKAKQAGEAMAKNLAPTFVGEYSGAMTDCAKWLNGRNMGARWDGSYDGGKVFGSCDGKIEGSVNALSADDKAAIKAYIKGQKEAFEKAGGWFFWTWINESAPEWNYKELAAAGLV